MGVPFHGQLDDTIAALALLLAVLFIATLYRRGPGMVAAVLGMLCYNFFLLPAIDTICSFTTTDPEKRRWPGWQRSGSSASSRHRPRQAGNATQRVA
jgi:hypothetical protein